MRFSVFLVGFVIATLLASACLAAILVYFSPISASGLIFLLFYLSLFIALTGFFSLIGLFIRWVSQKRKFAFSGSWAVRRLEISFRQGMFLALILVAVLILQSQRILTWWHLVVLIGLVATAEWWLSKG